MTITNLKKSIESKSVPNKMVWVDNNHTMVLYYLDNISLFLNRKIRKIFSEEEALSVIPVDFDSDSTIYVLYIDKKKIDQVSNLLGEAFIIFMVDETISTKLDQTVFSDLSRNATLAYLENYFKPKEKIKTKTARDDEKGEKHSEDCYVSREFLEEALDYFEGNLDNCMNEINKVSVLELSGSWDKPFKALLDCLPKKDTKLRSLKWFSGGDIDTCQVLYNLYIKKLRGLPDSPISDQKIWAKLVRESIWCEATTVSGLIGDYVVDYLKLIESSLPGDFKVEFFPPVFQSEIKAHPEWRVNNKEEN
jgi:hypothetical protein